jgi:hypothetical protein
VAARRAHDDRLAPALELIESSRGEDGRWGNRHAYTGKTWCGIEKQGRTFQVGDPAGLLGLRAAYG